MPFIGHTATGVGDGEGLGAGSERARDSAWATASAMEWGGGRWRRLGGAGQHDGAGGDEDGNEDEAAHGEQPGT